jgi:hypothetical protein
MAGQGRARKGGAGLVWAGQGSEGQGRVGWGGEARAGKVGAVTWW